MSFIIYFFSKTFFAKIGSLLFSNALIACGTLSSRISSYPIFEFYSKEMSY